jgi:hypothetical protein
VLDPRFSDLLASTGFAHRSSRSNDGYIVYALADGSGNVRLSRREWECLGEEFNSRMASVRRRTRLLSLTLLPATFVFGMTLAQFLPFGGAMILGLIFLGPLVIYIWHSFDVKKISGLIEWKLSGFQKCAPAERDVRREPRWFEIAFLVLVGPHLLISVAGEIGGPDLFRGTPLSGSGIGPAEAIALLFVAVRVAWPRIAPWLSQIGRGQAG